MRLLLITMNEAFKYPPMQLVTRSVSITLSIFWIGGWDKIILSFFYQIMNSINIHALETSRISRFILVTSYQSCSLKSITRDCWKYKETVLKMLKLDQNVNLISKLNKLKQKYKIIHHIWNLVNSSLT